VSSKAGLPQPKSKEAKRAQMKDAYGQPLAENPQPRRQSSRNSTRSVRSSHSVSTPVTGRKLGRGRFGPVLGSKLLKEPAVLNLMPSLKQQNQAPAEAEEVFDEEKEQQLLEEARKKKERAKKMREQQEKMLAEMKAKKEAKLREEEEKKIKE
jgi:hypothetical protein